MRRLASQPRNVRYGIPRRMRAQHQTTMTVHVRKLNRGMKQSNNNQSKQNNKTGWTRGGHRRHMQEHPHTPHTLHRTAAFAAAAGPELPCLLFWLPAAAAAAALASAPSATAPSEPTKGPAAGYFYYRHRLLLRRRCHHDWPAQRTRQSLVPSFYRCLVFLMERPDQTAAASLLHRTCTVFLGHTQTRVDLRFAPLLL